VSRDNPPPDDSHTGAAPRWCRPSALARRTPFSVRSIERYCRDGEITGAVRSPGGHWRIPEASAEAFLEKLRANATT
jgi:predicted site-specific integrase-resolvase